MEHHHRRRGSLLLPIYLIVIQLVCLTATRGLIRPSEADSMLTAPGINPRDAHHDNHSHFTFDCTYYHRRHLVPTKHPIRIDTGQSDERMRILRISSGDGIFLRCSMVIDHVDQCPTFLDRNSSVGINDEPTPDHCRDLRIVLEFPESLNQSRESNPMIEESVVAGKKQQNKKQKAINSTLAEAEAEAIEIDPESELYEAWINITNFTRTHQGVYRFSFYTLSPPSESSSSLSSSNGTKNHHHIKGTNQMDPTVNPFGTRQEQQLIYEYRFMLMMMNVATDETIISQGGGGGGGGNDPTTVKNSLSLWNTTRNDHSIKSRSSWTRIRSIILYKWWPLVIAIGLLLAMIIKRSSCTRWVASSITIHHIV